jgi:hypothetical protein
MVIFLWLQINGQLAISISYQSMSRIEQSYEVMIHSVYYDISTGIIMWTFHKRSRITSLIVWMCRHRLSRIRIMRIRTFSINWLPVVNKISNDSNIGCKISKGEKQPHDNVRVNLLEEKMIRKRTQIFENIILFRMPIWFMKMMRINFNRENRQIFLTGIILSKFINFFRLTATFQCIVAAAWLCIRMLIALQICPG